MVKIKEALKIQSWLGPNANTYTHVHAREDNVTCLAEYHLCPLVPYILSKCIWNVTSIKLLDTKVLESQPRGTNLRHCERCGEREDPPRRKGKLMPIIITYSRDAKRIDGGTSSRNFQMYARKYISSYNIDRNILESVIYKIFG